MAAKFDKFLGRIRDWAVKAADISDSGAAGRDLLRMQTLQEIQASVSKAVPRYIRPLYFNRLLHELPQCAAASGVGNTVRGDCRWSVTMTAGSNVVVYTGGTAIADAGAGNFAGVLLVGGIYTVVNVLGVSGNSITLAQNMQVSGAAVLGSYFDAVNGQHLSPMGGYALASLLCGASPYALQEGNTLYNTDSLRGSWYQTGWVSPFSSPEYWGAHGGVANNQLDYNTVANSFSASNVIFAIGTKSASVTCSAVGQGMTANIAVGGAAVVEVLTGHNNADASLQMQVQMLADGVVVYTGTQGGALTRHAAPLSCTTLTIRVTSLTASAVRLHVARTTVKQLAPAYQRAVEPGDVILPVGDSWTEESSRPEFIQGVRNYAAAVGATVLPSVGVGGTKASYALTAVSGVRRIDTWITAALASKCTKVLIHYYVNDYNAGDSAATWAANIGEIERTCIAAGLVPLFVLPGATASQAQSQSLNLAYQGVVGRSADIKQITRYLQSEVSAVGAFANKVGKYAGRTIAIPGVGTYVARGPAAADVWDCITAGATPVTVTPA